MFQKSCLFSVTMIVPKKKKPANPPPVHMLAFQDDGLLVQLTGEPPLVRYPRPSTRYNLSHRPHLKAVFRKPKKQNILARGRRWTWRHNTTTLVLAKLPQRGSLGFRTSGTWRSVTVRRFETASWRYLLGPKCPLFLHGYVNPWRREHFTVSARQDHSACDVQKHTTEISATGQDTWLERCVKETWRNLCKETPWKATIWEIETKISVWVNIYRRS